MKNLRPLALFAVLALAAAAIWLARDGGGEQPESVTATDEETAYDYEAQDVVVRQMGPDGRLQYQIEARSISQLPRSGRIEATDLVMNHDPPGTEPGGDLRWNVRADRAELPSEGGIVTLAGAVRVAGRFVDNRTTFTVTADDLRYDLEQQLIASDSEVAGAWGNGIRFRGNGLRANIKTGEVALESGIHGTFAP